MFDNLTHPDILRAMRDGGYDPPEAEYKCPACGHELDGYEVVYEGRYNECAGCEFCLTRTYANESLERVPVL